ncbi:MAG: hypothetical protein ACTS6G_05715 [Candidatus Hodgkinia cicadicola]
MFELGDTEVAKPIRDCKDYRAQRRNGAQTTDVGGTSYFYEVFPLKRKIALQDE